jgi:hypothetical protein
MPEEPFQKKRYFVSRLIISGLITLGWFLLTIVFSKPPYLLLYPIYLSLLMYIWNGHFTLYQSIRRKTLLNVFIPFVFFGIYTTAVILVKGIEG